MKDSPSHQVGQFLMVGVSSTTLRAEEKAFLREVQPKGVIYFRRNVDSPNQLIDLTREIRGCLTHAPIIGIDQEGGRVARLGAPFTVFPGNEMLADDYGQSGNLKHIINKAKWMAGELRAIGVNCNFTPVADVLTNPDNPIMRARTFGSDPQVVAKLVGQTIDIFNAQAMLSCAKHFPGHGDTLLDSHLALPTVDTSKSTLLKREIVPFAKAIARRVPMIMTAHIMYPKIDAEHPATLSRYFLHTLLRKQLKFTGCIVSDDLEMHAIAHHYQIDQACVRTIKAGTNIALVCEDQSLAYDCYQALAHAASHKEIQIRLAENQKLSQSWDKTYLATKRLRKRQHWGWKSHRFPKALINA